MAIGTALAIAGATIGGAILSSKAQKKAAKSASATAASTAASNNALAQNIYNQNSQALSPFQQRGNAAGSAINALLGIGQGATQNSMGTAQIGQPIGQQGFGQGQGYMSGGQWGNFGAAEIPYSSENGPMGGYVGGYGGGTFNPQGQQVTPQTDYNNAFQNYQNSTGYNFRMGQGVRALNASASARGIRNSGAAAKSAMNYGQGIGSAEFSNYLAQLANQQSVGLSGASAQAGVGQNYVNTVTANNNSAGTAAANAALLRGQSNANMWGQIGGAFGNVFGSSFG